MSGGAPSSAAAAAFLMNGGNAEAIEMNSIPFHLGQEDILIPERD